MPDTTVIPLSRTGNLPKVRLQFGTGVRYYDYKITLSPDDDWASKIAEAESTDSPKNEYKVGKTVEKLDKDALLFQIHMIGNQGDSDYWCELLIIQDGKIRGTPVVFKKDLKSAEYIYPEFIFTLVD